MRGKWWVDSAFGPGHDIHGRDEEESTGMVGQKEPEPESVKALLTNLSQKLGMDHNAKKKGKGRELLNML
jgi:hypothetical protein